MKNSTLIIFGTLICLSALIVFYSFRANKTATESINVGLNAIHGFNVNSAPIRLKVEDIPYVDEFKIEDGEALFVISSTHEKTVYKGRNLIATYNRESDLLVVEFKDDSDKVKIRYIKNPLEWGNE